MKLSTKSRYGIYVLVELTKNCDSYITVSELAKKTNVTEKYLEQILAILKKNNLVIAARGAGGGYCLADKAENISVGAALRALESNLELVDCISKDCNGKCECVSRNLWLNLYRHINDYLDTINLKQIAEDAL
ncbi:MAG: Rrf2 family transcriptional regulator [Corallococcus sp.]|nr:Rrf2 family transcriptional regulator [Corallococcus sp.]